MKTTAKIIPIGNSQGLRLPKKILEDLNLSNVVEIESRGNELIIRPVQDIHAGWEESAKAMRQRGDDAPLLDTGVASSWDDTEWQW